MIELSDAESVVESGHQVVELPHGGQKRVFKVNAVDGSPYVIKFVQIEERDPDDADVILPRSADEERTLREIRLMGSVTCDYLPSLGPVDQFEYEKDGLRFIGFSEEYIGDNSVKDLIRADYFDSPEKVQALAISVVSALNEYSKFESGFVHRDVKPGNIVKRNDGDVFVLIDGGVHLLPSNPTITSSSAFVGTRKYSSPEQLTQGRRQMDERSDMFSFGMVLYEAATGAHPFFERDVDPVIGFQKLVDANYDPIDPTSPMAIFNPIIGRLLTRHAHTRFTTLEDLQLELEGVL